MVSRDLSYIVSQLEKRLERLEEQLTSMARNETCDDQDWDNPRLLKNWKISERTAAYYRRKGLGYYKRGGRIYYTPEHRKTFIEQQ